MRTKKALMVLMLILATSIVTVVSAKVIVTNTFLSASSQATTPSFEIGWITSPPTKTLVGETWIAGIKVISNNGRILSGFKFVANVSGPLRDDDMLTLGLQTTESSYYSSLYGKIVDGKVQYTYSSLTVNPGENLLLIRGRYNVAGDYSWSIGITSADFGY